jgi:hypothetical protein
MIPYNWNTSSTLQMNYNCTLHDIFRFYHHTPTVVCKLQFNDIPKLDDSLVVIMTLKMFVDSTMNLLNASLSLQIQTIYVSWLIIAFAQTRLENTTDLSLALPNCKVQSNSRNYSLFRDNKCCLLRLIKH